MCDVCVYGSVWGACLRGDIWVCVGCMCEGVRDICGGVYGGVCEGVKVNLGVWGGLEGTFVWGCAVHVWRGHWSVWGACVGGSVGLCMRGGGTFVCVGVCVVRGWGYVWGGMCVGWGDICVWVYGVLV